MEDACTFVEFWDQNQSSFDLAVQPAFFFFFLHFLHELLNLRTWLRLVISIVLCQLQMGCHTPISFCYCSLISCPLL